jgi:TorA maturation chaperone TorD
MTFVPARYPPLLRILNLMSTHRGTSAGGVETVAPGPRPGLDLLAQLVAGVYASPGAGLWADLRSGAFAEAVQVLADELGLEPPACAWERLDWAELQSAHVHLFVTSVDGVTAPPYVGLALDGELVGPSSRALSDFLAAHGITVAGGWRDLPDHVAAVAEAISLLIAGERVEAADELVTHFVAPWFARYGEAVEKADFSGFYGPLTRFLSAAVEVRA